MDDNALIAYFQSGQDLTKLPELDLVRLHSLVKKTPQGPPRELLQTEAQAPPTGLQSLANPPTTPANFPFTGPETLDLIKTGGLRTLEAIFGAATGGMGFIPRVTSNMAFSGLTGLAEGDPIENAAAGGAIETGGAVLSKMPRVGAGLALLTGGGRQARPNTPLKELIDAYERVRGQGLGKGIAVGDIEGAKAAKSVANTQLETLETAQPGKVSPYKMNGAATEPMQNAVSGAMANDTQNALGKDEVEEILQQLQVRGVDVDQAMRDINDGRALVGLPDIQGRTQRTIQALQSAGEDAPMSVRETMELSRGQNSAGRSLFNPSPDRPNLPWDKPRQQAYLNRGTLLKEEAQSLMPGESRSQHDRLTQLISDLHSILDTSVSTRSPYTIGAASARSGLGFGLGAGIGGVTGIGAGPGGMIGGALGLSASPQNISRVGNALGRTGRVAPTVVRGARIYEDVKDERKKQTRRRNPQ